MPKNVSPHSSSGPPEDTLLCLGVTSLMITVQVGLATFLLSSSAQIHGLCASVPHSEALSFRPVPVLPPPQTSGPEGASSKMVGQVAERARSGHKKYDENKLDRSIPNRNAFLSIIEAEGAALVARRQERCKKDVNCGAKIMKER